MGRERERERGRDGKRWKEMGSWTSFNLDFFFSSLRSIETMTLQMDV
jgi:hypothetical protein